MHPSTTPLTADQQNLLDGMRVHLLDPDELPRCQRLLDEHHYLGSLQPVVEAKALPRPTQTSPELKSLCEHFKRGPDYRVRIGFYPLWSLLTIVACAHRADAPRGQKVLAAFSKRLSQRQLRALVSAQTPPRESIPPPARPPFAASTPK